MDFKNNPFRSRVFVIVSSAVFWGILAHGMALFNKFSYHDDTSAFNGVGVTYDIGRWALALMGDSYRKLTGGYLYSIPLINGMTTIVCIGLILFLVYRMMDFTDPFIGILVTGIFVTFPSVTSVFGYMFTAPYYYFGLLLGVWGISIYDRRKSILSMAACIALLCFSTGVYQANLHCCVSVMVLLLIRDVSQSECRFSDFLKKAVTALLLALASLLLYLGLNRFFLKQQGISLIADHRGLDTMGMTDLSGYLSRMAKAYKEFFFPTAGSAENMFPFTSRYLHMAIIAVCLILAVMFLVKVYRENILKGLELSILLALYPLAAYLIFVIVNINGIHSLMTFGEVFTFLLAVWLYEKVKISHRLIRILKKSMIVLISLLLFMNIRFSNLCYLKADVLQSQVISYYTTLAARIRSVKQYTDETPVVYINASKKHEVSLAGADPWFKSIELLPYNFSTLINNYEWKNNMAFWTGFNPIVASSEPFLKSPIVAVMPSYPDNGSIKYIDGCIVVKFS